MIVRVESVRICDCGGSTELVTDCDCVSVQGLNTGCVGNQSLNV
jgi:hypothetical protein